MGGAEVQIRGSKANIVGPVDTRPLSCDVDHPDICDRSSRILGQVNVTNQINIRPLDCNIDHPDICDSDRAGRLIGITGRNWNLNYATDSVTVVNTPPNPTPRENLRNNKDDK